MMASLIELQAAAVAAARRGLDPTDVTEVQLDTASGADGDEILRVLVVVPDVQFEQIDGSHFLSALLNVQQAFRRIGEERLVLVEYATPSELVDDGDAES